MVNNDFPSANFIGEKGEKEIETVSIDEDILEKITLLKMDIEGAEQKAIEGSKRHIKEEKPNTYKRISINKMCKKIAGNKIQGAYLSHKINPILIKILDGTRKQPNDL